MCFEEESIELLKDIIIVMTSGLGIHYFSLSIHCFSHMQFGHYTFSILILL